MQNINTKCDCVVVRDPETGVLRALSKCRLHVRALMNEMRSEEEHYERLGAMNADTSNYIREFEECFWEVDPPSAVTDGIASMYALEIGPGTSPYIQMLVNAGYAYYAIEPSLYACDWLDDQDDVDGVYAEDWEQSKPWSVGLILAAHSIEHMEHAPNAIKKMADSLTSGGVLYIIVPDDEDLCNPDHWWFFDTDTLKATVENAGLKIEIMEIRRRVPHEQFIYCKAVKA